MESGQTHTVEQQQNKPCWEPRRQSADGINSANRMITARILSETNCWKFVGWARVLSSERFPGVAANRHGRNTNVRLPCHQFSPHRLDVSSHVPGIFLVQSSPSGLGNPRRETVSGFVLDCVDRSQLTPDASSIHSNLAGPPPIRYTIERT